MQKYTLYSRRKSFSMEGGYIVMFEATATEKPVDTVPLFFIPGWGASPSSVQNFISELTALGRTVLVLDHEQLDSCGNEPTKRYNRVPCLEYNKAY